MHSLALIKSANEASTVSNILTIVKKIYIKSQKAFPPACYMVWKQFVFVFVPAPPPRLPLMSLLFLLKMVITLTCLMSSSLDWGVRGSNWLLRPLAWSWRLKGLT